MTIKKNDFKNDEVIQKEIDTTIVEQMNGNIVGYKIINVFKDEEKTMYRSLRLFKDSPPILIIENERGDFVEFEMTREFVRELTNDLKHIERAYSGYTYVVNNDNKITNIIKKARENPLITMFTIGLLALFLIYKLII